ncbi:MAG: protein kinase [Planctomycetota bacterium]
MGGSVDPGTSTGARATGPNPGAIQGSAARTTVQLGADYLSYARERFDALTFKNQLVERLLPTVPRSGVPRAVRSGQAFGKFEILDRLGKGGMAQVYLAIDPERQDSGAEAQVALKVMKPEIALNPEFVLRFLREAANTSLIAHPNVVSVHEVGSVDGRLYFTMELIEGVTLKDHLKEGPVSEAEGVQILCQLVDGLVAAHGRGVAHRDLKPANVMILTSQTRYGFQIQGEFDIQVKITDFGLAHQLALDESAAKADGQFLGTAKYVAPEVVKGEEPTLKSDVFSLGILAYTMFTGESPFRARSKIEYVTANLEQEAPPLKSRAQVSDELSRLVDRMLTKDPARRPAAEAVARDLRRLMRRRGGERVVVRDDPESSFGQISGRATRLADSLADLPAATRWAGVAGVLGAVLVLGWLGLGWLGLGWLARGSGSSPAPSPPPSVSPIDTGPRPSATASATKPPRPAGDPRERSVPLPPTGAFRDRLARAEFPRRVEQGEAAWARQDAPAALAAWQGAAALLSGSPPAELAARLREAARATGLARGRALLEARDYVGAARELEAALKLAPDDRALRALHAEADAARGDAERVSAGLRKAKSLAFSPETRGEAIALLRELLPVAERLDLAGPLRAELEKLGAAPGPGPGASPGPSPGAPQGPAPSIVQVDEFLRQRSWDAAALAIKQAREKLGEVPEVQRLRLRLDRGRRTPAGWVLLEAEGAPDEVPAACYARRAPVTHRELHAWFTKASGALPPRSWEGRSEPPAALLDSPVTGVREEEARRFASERGERLPSDAERAALAAALRRPIPGPSAGRFDEGFYTVSDVR